MIGKMDGGEEIWGVEWELLCLGKEIMVIGVEGDF